MMRFALGLVLSVALGAAARADRIGPAGGTGLQPSGNASLTTVLATGSTTARTLAARTSERINIRDYGALGDAVSTTTAVTTSGASVTTTAGMFSASNVGEIISITGAGAAGVTYSGTVASYTSATSITVTPSPATTLTASSQTVVVGHDDSTALAAAIGVANTRMALGSYPCIYVPAANYLIGGGTAPVAFAQGKPGCVVGDGTGHSDIRLASTFAGDLFAWSEAWVVTAAGATVSGVRIDGTPTAPAQQNALMFYDRNDQVLLLDVDVWNLPGRALYSGMTKNTSQAYMRESHMRGLRFFNDGATGAPVVEFTSQGGVGTDGTNEIRTSQIDIFGSNGPSVVVRNNSSGTIRDVTFDALRIEGTQNGTTAADLLTVGDGTMTGGVNNIAFSNLELVDPYTGYAAMRVTAPAGGSQPYAINAQGTIGGGLPNGLGLVITSGRQMRFDFTDIHTNSTNVTVGPVSGGVGGQIEIKGPGGREGSWTWSVDASAINSLQSPIMRIGNPSVPTTIGVALGLHDGSSSGGNTIGAGAVDLQSQRNLATQVASGPGAVLLGGAYSSATASGSIVLGGSSNASSGLGGFIAGSIQASDRGRASSQAYSSGAAILYGVGSAQAGRQALVATGTSAMRLTASQYPASSSFSPIFNIPNNTAYNLSIRLVAIDRTAPTNSYHWTAPLVALTRQGSAGTTALTLGTGSLAPGSLAIGSAAATVSATADTTNGGLNLTFTPPAGTDTWDAFADVVSAEVQ